MRAMRVVWPALGAVSDPKLAAWGRRVGEHGCYQGSCSLAGVEKDWRRIGGRVCGPGTAVGSRGRIPRLLWGDRTFLRVLRSWVVDPGLRAVSNTLRVLSKS